MKSRISTRVSCAAGLVLLLYCLAYAALRVSYCGFDSRPLRAKADVFVLAGAVEVFAERNGRSPASLVELILPDESGRALLDAEAVPLDPWGREFVYRPPRSGAEACRILSYGADGEPGGWGEDRDVDSAVLLELER